MRLAAVRSVTAVSLVAALAVSIRAMAGPLVVGPLHFVSPMGMESLFAGMFLAVVLLQSQRSALPNAIAKSATRVRIAPLLLALAIVAVAYIPSLWNPFLSDDYILVSRATLDPARILAVFHTPGGDGSFRPLGYLYFALLHQFGGADPLKWHACALCIHLIDCALLYLILNTTGLGGVCFSLPSPPCRGAARGEPRSAGEQAEAYPTSRADPLVRTGPPGPVLRRFPYAGKPGVTVAETVAFLAAVLFGLNGTRPESVAWTAGNFDLLACAFVLAATLAVLRNRIVLALPLLLLGLLSKESAYAAPAVIFCFAAAADRLRESRIRLALAGSIAICAALIAYRWSLFHGPGGYINPATGQAQVLSFHLGTALKALFLRIWANLLFPVNWDASRHSAVLGAALLAGSFAIVYAAFANRIPRRLALSMLALTIGAVLPAYHLALIGDNLSGSRILYLPAAGFCVLCAYLIQRSRLPAVVLVVSTAVILLHNLDAWHRNAILADQVCSGASTQAPVHDLNGVVFFANGYRECVEMKRLPSR
jgi:hypothetical protein